MVLTLLSGPMVYTLFSCFPKEIVFTIALRPRGRVTNREKRGAKVVVYTLFSPGILTNFGRILLECVGFAWRFPTEPFHEINWGILVTDLR